VSVAQAAVLPFVKSGRISGPASALDRRVAAVRPDLADLCFIGDFGALHYAAPVAMTAQAPFATVRLAPSWNAEQSSELLFGEPFDAIEVSPDWSWGYAGPERYVGYVPTAALAAPGPAPTHWVSAPEALVFQAASIKSPVMLSLPQNARMAATGDSGDFLELASGGFIHTKHVRALGDWASDPAAQAARWIGAPYLWGGKRRQGCDCSGLVQAALLACGIPIPRDCNQQQGIVGNSVPIEGPYQRNDLIYFPGHVGIMVDATNLLHANAHHMATVVEPLADVLERLKPKYEMPILAVKRLQ
jgi:cell wall-associated NlpC family hydrolase